MHLPEKQKTKISVHAETTEYLLLYRIVSAYVYTTATIYKPLLTGKASTTVGSFIAMYIFGSRMCIRTCSVP